MAAQRTTADSEASASICLSERFTRSIEIARPPEAVWAVVADPRNDPRWCRKVKSVEAAGERGWTVTHRRFRSDPRSSSRSNTWMSNRRAG